MEKNTFPERNVLPARGGGMAVAGRGKVNLSLRLHGIEQGYPLPAIQWYACRSEILQKFFR